MLPLNIKNEFMLKLTSEQKKDLEDLKKRPWFKVLIEIIEDLELSTFRNLKWADLSDEKQLKVLTRNMDYLKWMEDIRNTLNTSSNCVSERSDKNKEEED